MNLNNIKGNFLGDSITFGHGLNSQSQAFHQMLKEEACMAASRNYGISRTRIAKQIGEDDLGSNFVERAAIMDRDADLIVVFGGTNDHTHGDAAFGNYDSRDIKTFCGALNTLIDALKAQYPKAILVFMTPLHKVGEDIPNPYSKKQLSDYAKAISDLSAKKGIYCLDLFNCCKLNPNTQKDREQLCPDGIHPNAQGHLIIKNVLKSFLEKI